MADNFFMTSSHQPNLEDVCDNQKMMSIVQNNHQKKGQNWEILGIRLHCFGCRARQKYGGTYYTFYEEEKAKLLLKNIARRARIQLNILRSSYLDHRNKRKSDSNNKTKIKSVKTSLPSCFSICNKGPWTNICGMKSDRHRTNFVSVKFTRSNISNQLQS